MQKNTLPDQCWKTFAPKIAQAQFAQIHTGWTPLLISYVAYNHIHRRKKLQILVLLLFSFWLLPSIIFVGVIFEVHQNLPPTKKKRTLEIKILLYLKIFLKNSTNSNFTYQRILLWTMNYIKYLVIFLVQSFSGNERFFLVSWFLNEINEYY